MSDGNEIQLTADDFIIRDPYEETFVDVYRKVMEHLIHLFCRAMNKGWSNEYFVKNGRELFMTNIAKPLFDDNDFDPRSMEPPRSYLRDELLLVYVRFACAWAITANRANDAGEERKSWLCLCRAQHRLGRANQIADLPAKIKHVATKVSSAGGRGRAAKRNPLKEYARNLALKGSYTSQSHAAKRIVARVMEHAKETGDPWNPKDPVRSVERMLEGLDVRRTVK
ncbi:hypothetical protein [Caballeronia sp. DA-9]|uniref:hypothetical protein n=1 Tax=Caballeronia sp. DA-9 TaxID=3436237 RepID=UPI003F663BD3